MDISEKTQSSANVGSMVGQRCIRWMNCHMKSTLGKRLGVLQTYDFKTRKLAM